MQNEIKDEAQNNNSNVYDYIVIGAGSGGVRLSRLLGASGAKVAVVEAREIGGTCVIRGCIPKKLLIYATSFGGEIAAAKGYGWNAEAKDFNLSAFVDAKDRELERLGSIYNSILEKNNVEIIKGFARFVNEDTIEVDGKPYEAKKYIIATGGMPAPLPLEGEQHAISSEDFLDLRVVPKTALVIGGGYIGTEFTRVLTSMRTKVNVFIRSGIPLRGFDADISVFIKEELERQGVEFIDAKLITRIEKLDDNKYLTSFENGLKLETDLVVNVAGRVPNVHNMGIENAGIKTAKHGAIITDTNFQTSNARVYAIGDVIDKMNLTPVAIKQAMHLASHFLNPEIKQEALDYHFVPKAVFCWPEVSACGFTEAQAKEKGLEIEVYKSTFTPLKYSLLEKKVRSFFKIVVEKKSRKVLGIHIVDTHAAEIMQGFAAAIRAGITKEELDTTVGLHPTSAEELVTMYTKAE